LQIKDQSIPRAELASDLQDLLDRDRQVEGYREAKDFNTTWI
jgi:hypothetical protein